MGSAAVNSSRDDLFAADHGTYHFDRDCFINTFRSYHSAAHLAHDVHSREAGEANRCASGVVKRDASRGKLCL